MPVPIRRLRLFDELGMPKALAPGHDVVRRSSGSDWFVLGLGPDPRALADGLPRDARVAYLECPAFFEQAGEAWRAAIPSGWRRVEAFDPLSDRNVLLYGGALRLFPAFWGPGLAALRLPRPAPPEACPGKTALVPDLESRLIVPEAVAALREEGYAVVSVGSDGLAAFLARNRPDLYFSVNFAGLDRYGETQALLARAGVPVAVWCVDNPFHALSGVKTQAWKDLHLFVTDAWFVDPLRRHGAKKVHHLPLAASPGFFRATADHPGLADKLLFVGRSAFPGKERFFAGLTLPEALWATAQAMLRDGRRPDFAWWSQQLEIESLWPGQQARRAGFGAEESGLVWRSLVIREAARSGRLAVCGDAAWREAAGVPFELLPCVDYYGPLAGMYASARSVVGAVSPLLPHGLTQRHFDVWAAGGCLLTDRTPGLDIFPRELTDRIVYDRAGDIPALAGSLDSDRDGLIRSWRKLIAARHTYRHRIRTLLDCLS